MEEYINYLQLTHACFRRPVRGRAWTTRRTQLKIYLKLTRRWRTGHLGRQSHSLMRQADRRTVLTLLLVALLMTPLHRLLRSLRFRKVAKGTSLCIVEHSWRRWLFRETNCTGQEYLLMTSDTSWASHALESKIKLSRDVVHRGRERLFWGSNWAGCRLGTTDLARTCGQSSWPG